MINILITIQYNCCNSIHSLTNYFILVLEGMMNTHVFDKAFALAGEKKKGKNNNVNMVNELEPVIYNRAKDYQIRFIRKLCMWKYWLRRWPSDKKEYLTLFSLFI